MKYISSFMLLILILTSCFDIEDRQTFFETGEVMGFKPIYANEADLEVEYIAPQPLKNPGKIYFFNNIFFINERFEGIHIYNNYNPENPVNIGFIKIKGNVDIALRDNVLYADNLQDLISIDVSNIQNPQVIQRIENVMPSTNLFPPQHDVYFECPEPEKGVVVGWQEALLVDPKCRR
ncbi:MAG: hypothetical protein ACOCXH_11965 [Cyclobacteriaceae bacterium]